MDFQLIFNRLFPGENVHPRICESNITYNDLANNKWRGSSPIPSLTDCQQTWNTILVERPELTLPVNEQKVVADKQAAKDAMTHSTPLVRLMRCSDRITYKSIVQVRQAFNDLLDILAQGRFPTAQEKTSLKLPIRTWSQLKQATQAEIDNDDSNN